MKKIYFLFFFITGMLTAQTVIGPNLTNPRGLIIIDDFAYFYDSGQVKRINVNNPTTPNTVIAGPNGYIPYTLESSSNGLYLPNTGQNNVDNITINGSSVSIQQNFINGTGGTIGFAFQDDSGNTYFTRQGTTSNAQLRLLLSSPNSSNILASSMPDSVQNILDVATIGSDFYFSTANGIVWYFNRNNTSAGFTQFLSAGVGKVISGIEVTQDYLYYVNATDNTVVRVLRTNGSQSTNLFSNLGVNYIDIKDEVVYGLTTNLAQDRLYAFTDPALVQIVNIPDANFKAELTGNTSINTNGDTEISVSEAISYTNNISVSNKSISNLTGIEAFTNITELYCSNNQLTNLDISQNTALTDFFCENNQLTSLNVANGNNTNLSFMSATGNPNLSCIQHDTSYDPTTNSNWQKDTTANWSTNCSTSSCIVNIPDANFKGALIADTFINTNSDSEIQCSEASAYLGSLPINNLGITDFTGIEAFTAIDDINFSDNSATSIDLSNNINLISIDGSSSSALTNVTLPATNTLESITFVSSGISTINTSVAPQLKSANFNSCLSLSSLNLNSNTALETLDITNTIINTLNVSSLTQLTAITFAGTLLQQLDLSNNSNLSFVNGTFNTSLTELNIANGNNSNISNGSFFTFGSPNLSCIQVNDLAYAQANWANDVDDSMAFSLNCYSLSTNDFDINNNTKLYPNPVSTILNIQTTSSFKNATVYSVLGKRILQSNSKTIDVSSLKQGIYFLKVESELGTTIKRFIKN